MTTTTAKPSGPSGLRTLLEAADSGNPIELGEDMAWKLARLVVTLTEALELGGEHDGPCDNVGVPWHKEEPCTLHISKSAERKAAARADGARVRTDRQAQPDQQCDFERLHDGRGGREAARPRGASPGTSGRAATSAAAACAPPSL